MGVFKGTYDLQKEGSRDAARHQEKLKEAFKKHLKDIISEENIITHNNGKKVKVPIKGLDQYRFIFDQKKTKHIGQGDGETQEGDIVHREPRPGDGQPSQPGDEEGDEIYEAEIELADLVEMMLEDLGLPRLDPKKKADLTVPETVWNDISKKGSMGNMHKKRTIIENMRRNAQQNGKPYFGDLKQDDLRYKSWKEEFRPITSAVVIAMMDVSGSMTTDKKYIARSFFFWMTQFLRRKYENVEIIFVSHTTTAKEVTEEQFFTSMESGGTMCASAYNKALEIIDTRFDPSLWNIFAFHFSDGETWNDEDECVSAIKKLCKLCNMVGYGEIDIDEYNWGGNWSTLAEYYAEHIPDEPNFVQATITEKDQVYPVLRKFFSEQYEEE